MFIEEVRKFPAVWNTSHEYYKKPASRTHILFLYFSFAFLRRRSTNSNIFFLSIKLLFIAATILVVVFQLMVNTSLRAILIGFHLLKASAKIARAKKRPRAILRLVETGLKQHPYHACKC